jgi:hypothetical protein
LQFKPYHLSYTSPFTAIENKRRSVYNKEKEKYTRVYPKVSGLSHNEIYAYNNKHSLRTNTKAYGGKTHYTASQNSDTTAPSGRELHHLQFSLQAASPETFGYILIYYILSFIKGNHNRECSMADKWGGVWRGGGGRLRGPNFQSAV